MLKGKFLFGVKVVKTKRNEVLFPVPPYCDPPSFICSKSKRKEMKLKTRPPCPFPPLHPESFCLDLVISQGEEGSGWEGARAVNEKNKKDGSDSRNTVRNAKPRSEVYSGAKDEQAKC